MNPPALQDETEARLRDIVAGVLGIPIAEIGPELERAAAANWSSLNHLLLISEIELQFQVAFTNADIAAIERYADVSRALARQLVAGQR